MKKKKETKFIKQRILNSLQSVKWQICFSDKKFEKHAIGNWYSGTSKLIDLNLCGKCKECPYYLASGYYYEVEK